mgnify:CR=1 FL=1
MDVMLTEKNPIKKLVDKFAGNDIEMWWNADKGKLSIYYLGYPTEQKDRLRIINLLNQYLMYHGVNL